MNKFEVIWTKNTQLDLESIIEYIKIDSVNIAKKIFFEIKKECENLPCFYERKRVVPELQQIGISKYREIIYEKYRIIFKIDNSKIYVLLIVDLRRNLEDILFQRLIEKK